MKKDALISDCGTYRYWLTREWAADQRSACFIGLNPSTADAVVDDPTIRRCINFAKSWGCGSLRMVNLFAFRATNPKELLAALDPVGSNDEHLLFALQQCSPVVAAWGVNGTLKNRDDEVIQMIRGLRYGAQCLGVTKGGHPRHPLYVRADQPLITYR